MDFINALLSSLVEAATTLLVVIMTFVSTTVSFLEPPQTPITLVPEQTAQRFPEAPVAPHSLTDTSKIAEIKITLPRLPAATNATLIDVNTLARNAVVNILCIGRYRSASGSGVIIDNRGVILTNAHIGQYFLLDTVSNKNSTACTIRAGSPAKNAYHAKLLYLPTSWVSANAQKIAERDAVGTGEDDYAFLLITDAYEDTSLPSTFPSIPYTVEEPYAGDAMLLAAYPSASLSNKNILNNLLVSSTFTIVKKLYSFNPPHTIDLFSIGSTSISQGGASGGAAARAKDGKVMGIITLATEASIIEERDLRAITLAHINRSLTRQNEGGINQLLSGDLSAKANAFDANTAPLLRKMLTDAL